MSAPSICTIVSNNYLAFGRVLADSFLHQHPEGRVFVLVVDEPDGTIDYAGENFEVLFARDLAIPNFPTFSFRYSILELNTAVKPFFLAFLETEFGVRDVFYFDPDILILSGLDRIHRQLQTQDLMLTPHITRPLEDQKLPSERHILLAGVYNLGFLGLSFNDRTRDFLRWWQARLYEQCLHRPETGIFVDQRWMDFAPAFLPRVYIVRDPVLNIAYWNLPHRHPKLVGDRWTLEEQPVCFFHFSGFEPDHPETLSKHQDRYTLSSQPELRPLFLDYRDRLVAAGWEDTKSIPYAYGSFDNQVPIPPVARVALSELDAHGDRWPSPFSCQGTETFFHWLAASMSPDLEPELPRIGLYLWESRPDLQGAFPDPTGNDRLQYAQWLTSAEPQNSGVSPVFFESLHATLGERVETPLAAPRPVNAEPSWLTAEAALEENQAPRIPRLAMMIRQDRPDLQHAFRDPLGQSRTAFAKWYVTYGRREYGLPKRLIEPVMRTLPLTARLQARVWWAHEMLGGSKAAAGRTWRNFLDPDPNKGGETDGR